MRNLDTKSFFIFITVSYMGSEKEEYDKLETVRAWKRNRGAAAEYWKGDSMKPLYR